MKLPFLQFYPSDFLRDTRALSLSAKGAWIDIICVLHASEARGTASFSVAAWSRSIGATPTEFADLVTELETLKIADVKRESNGHVTLSSRRMIREDITKEQTRLRVERHRKESACNGDGNGNVTVQKVRRSEGQKVRNSARAIPETEKLPLPESPRFGLPASLDTPAMRTAWDRWLVHWATAFANGRPMPEQTAHSQLRDLAAIGPERGVIAIENSIAKGSLRKPAEPFPEKNHANNIAANGRSFAQAQSYAGITDKG